VLGEKGRADDVPVRGGEKRRGLLIEVGQSHQAAQQLRHELARIAALAAEVSAQADVETSRLALLQAEGKATAESPLKAPVW
jgi:hypothetical protein